MRANRPECKFLLGSIGVAQEAQLGASVISEVSIVASRGAGEAIIG